MKLSESAFSVGVQVYPVLPLYFPSSDHFRQLFTIRRTVWPFVPYLWLLPFILLTHSYKSHHIAHSSDPSTKGTSTPYPTSHHSLFSYRSFLLKMVALDIIDNSPHHPDPSPPVPTAANAILIDNYDSFTYNVYQYLVLEGASVKVFRNDQISLDELIALSPTQLIISPGPGHPQTDSGISRDAIRHFAGKIPIMGVCMGQ